MDSVEYNAYKSNKIFRILFCGVFLVVGITFLTAGIIWYGKTKLFIENADLVEAEIVEIQVKKGDDSTSHRPIIEYEYEDENYITSLSEYSSSMHEGKTIEIYVNEDDPEKVIYKGMTYFGPILFSGMGLLFTLIGLIVFILSSHTLGMSKEKKANFKQELKAARKEEKYNKQRFEDKMDRQKEYEEKMSAPERNGAVVKAEIIDCKPDYTLAKKDKTPYRLYCRCTFSDGGERFFISEPVWENLNMYVLDEIDVYIQDEQTAFVDVESFMKLKGIKTN